MYTWTGICLSKKLHDLPIEGGPQTSAEDGDSFHSHPSVSIYDGMLRLACIYFQFNWQYVKLWSLCDLKVEALDYGCWVHRFKSHQLPLEKNLLHLTPHPGPSKAVNGGSGLGWRWLRSCTGCVMFFQGTGGISGTHPMVGRHKSVLLWVPDLSPGVCLVVVQEFPEVAPRAQALTGTVRPNMTGPYNCPFACSFWEVYVTQPWCTHCVIMLLSFIKKVLSRVLLQKETNKEKHRQMNTKKQSIWLVLKSCMHLCVQTKKMKRYRIIWTWSANNRNQPLLSNNGQRLHDQWSNSPKLAYNYAT